MPSIEEFKQQCQLLGLDHIEVVSVDKYNDTTDFEGLSRVEAVELIKTRDKISDTIYDRYESELKKTDIVFFYQGEGTGVVFIGNAVTFNERGSGPDESWSYKTHKVSIPMKGGIRSFSASIKDEIVAQGFLGIIANSLDDMEDGWTIDKDGIKRGKYKEDSLYGKMEEKIKVLMGDQETLENVKVPWIYNVLVFAPGMYFEKEIYMKFTSSIKNTLYQTNVTSNNFIEPVYISLSQYQNGVFYYTFQHWSKIKTTLSNTILQSIILKNNAYYDMRTHKMGRPGYNQFLWVVDIESARYAYQRFYNLYGGYNSPNNPPTNADSNSTIQTIQLSDPINYTIYSQQPYLVGAVLWITDIYPNNTYPQIGGYFTIVGFDKYGKIIPPKCPYWTKEKTEINGSSIAAHTPYEYSSELADKLEPIPDQSPYSPLRGKSLLEVGIPMTNEEANYAQNLNYIIVPEDYIPENYIEE